MVWYYLGNKGSLVTNEQGATLEPYCNTVGPEDATLFESVPYHVLKDEIDGQSPDLTKYGIFDVLVLLAHPDDDVYISGMLRRMRQNGHTVHVAFVTSGRAGTDIRGTIVNDADAMQAQRETEANAALTILGIEDIYPLRQDVGWEHTTNEFSVEDEDAIQSELDSQITANSFTPDVILTFSHTGIYGHEEHYTTHRVACEQYRKSSAKAILFFDYPKSDRIYGANPAVGGDITYRQGQSHGVDDNEIDYIVDLTSDDLIAKDAHLRTYVSQFDTPTADATQGHYAVRPYEYVIYGSGKKGSYNKESILSNLFDI
jgi:LmbE family N-acetylglucosaminyl deacetylase